MGSPDFKRRVEEKLHVVVEYAPSKYHEGVGSAEANTDILTRMAEANVKRSKLGIKYFLRAREVAQELLNERAKHGEDKTRWEVAFDELPDFTRVPPYLYGATVAVYRERQDRGPNGSTDDSSGRTYQACNLGRHGTGYIGEVTRDGQNHVPTKGPSAERA